MKGQPGRLPYLYLALPLGLLLLMFAWPFFGALWLSLHDDAHSLYHPAFVGLQNVALLLKNGAFVQALQNTVLYGLLIVPAMVLLPMGVAVMLNDNTPVNKLFRVLLYLPVVVSMVAAGLAWQWLLQEEGLLNYLLQQGVKLLGFGLIPAPAATPWLVMPATALLAIAVVVIWKGLGYYMMIYLSHLQHISSDLYEAAALDGAGPLARFWYVTRPLLKPAAALVGLVSTIGCLKLFTEIYVMTRGGPMGGTQSAVYALYDLAFEQLKLGQASAAGLLLMLLLVVLSSMQWLLRQKNTLE
ncbi:MAG: sugar ABC transporter permease [Vampirovibrionales bacterium]|nr:sugar ABC transporter permease [Vampirovibrionales bacterium]